MTAEMLELKDFDSLAKANILWQKYWLMPALTYKYGETH